MRKNRWLLLLCLLFCGWQMLAQNKDTGIRDLLKMESYQPDKEAGALIVYDKGETNFFNNDNGFYTIFTRKLRVKFYSDVNLDFSEISIPIYSDGELYEEIQGFAATVYNLEGEVITTIQTFKKALLEEKYSKNLSYYKVAVAGVKAGAVMDVEYEVKSPYLFRMPGWQFQYEIPVLYSEYLAHMVPFYNYCYIVKGCSKLDEFTSDVESGLPDRIASVEYQKTLYKFVKTNIPAFQPDDYITSENDYLISLEFQLAEFTHLNGYKQQVMTTWTGLTSDMIKKTDSFGGYLKSCRKLAKKILAENQFTYTTQKEFLEKLVTYIRSNYDWNGMRGYLAEHKTNEVERTKKGNVADLNLLLVAVLQEAGFNTEPVMLSTRDHGKIYVKYPFTHYFNYVIALTELDGVSYLSDATDKQTCFDQIPPRCINEYGLVVKKGEENWITLTSDNPSMNITSFFYRINSGSDSLLLRIRSKESGYYALGSKSRYATDSAKYIEDVVSPIFDEISDVKVTSSDTTKIFQVSAEGYILPTRIEKYISVKPFRNEVYTNNPFKSKDRAYPVDFTFARKSTYSAQILLPDGAKLVREPENISMDNDYFSLNYSFLVSDNAIVVNADYCLKKPVYAATLYPGLKNFFDNMIKYFNQNIEIEL